MVLHILLIILKIKIMSFVLIVINLQLKFPDWLYTIFNI